MYKKSAPKKFIKKKNSRKITVSLPQPSKSSGQVGSASSSQGLSEDLKKRSFFSMEGISFKKSSFAFLGKEFTFFMLVFLSICFIFLLAVAGWFYLNFTQAQQMRLAAQDNFSYWQEVAMKQQNSPDAYYQAAIYAVQLDKNQIAFQDLKKALELDPGFERAKQLQKQLTLSN